MPPTDVRWLPEAELQRLCTDADHCGWLTERGSLTQRLRTQWGEVAVQVITEGPAVPLPHEAQRLGLELTATAWVRSVSLLCRGRPRLHARTVIPAWSPHNPWAQVQHLGRQPLGELLFSLPDLQRSAFEWAADLPWPDAAPGQAPVGPGSLARRCVFVRAGAPLLLTELFPGFGERATADAPACRVSA